MNIDEERILKDLEYVKNRFLKSSNKKNIYYNYYNIILFEEIIKKLLTNEDIFKKLKSPYNLYNEEKERRNFITKEETKFNNIINNNLDIFYSISTSYSNFFDNLYDDYDMEKIEKKNFNFNGYRYFNESEFKDIILSYFSLYGNNIYNIAKSYFDENRIQLGFNLFDDEENVLAGFFINILYLSKGYIFLKYDKFDTNTASSLVHEIGHAIDYETFIYPQKKIITTSSDYMQELSSTTFEIGFLDYLYENHIDIKGSINMLIYKYFNLYYNLIDVYYELTNKLDYFSEYFRNDVVYSLGYYFALHLNKIRKENNEEFQKIFNNILTSRKEYSLESLIKMTGFNLENFINGIEIQNKIEDDFMKLNKTYNV